MSIKSAPKKGDTLFMVREKGYGSRQDRMGPAKVVSRGPKYFRVVFEGEYPGNPIEFFTANLREHYAYGRSDYELFEDEASWVSEVRRRNLVKEVKDMMTDFDFTKATISELTTIKAALS